MVAIAVEELDDEGTSKGMEEGEDNGSTKELIELNKLTVIRMRIPILMRLCDWLLGFRCMS